MKHVDMAWEWNWPSKTGTWHDLLHVSAHFLRYDHSPGFCVYLGLFGWTLLDFGYYNIHHEDCCHETPDGNV